MTDLTALLQRIGRAAGLSPVALATVMVACGPGSDTPDEVGRGGSRAPDAVDPSSPSSPSSPWVPQPEPEEPVAELELPVFEGYGEPVRNHVFEGRIRGVREGLTYQLHLGTVDVDRGHRVLKDVQVVAEFRAVADGDEPVRGIIDEANPQLGVRAAVVGPDGTVHHGQIAEYVVQLDDPDVPDVSELHPGVRRESLRSGQTWRVCVPEAVYADAEGQCPGIDADPWVALEMSAYALHDSLPPELSAAACEVESAFPNACCLVVELFEAMEGPRDNICNAPREPANGGGGYGWGLGRPLSTVAGAVQAPLRAGGGWAAGLDALNVPEEHREPLAAAWLAMARAEHASVASFARFSLELMALGAPPHLLAEAAQAQIDEVRHAELAFAVAAAVGGRPVEPGPLPLAGILDRSADAEAVLCAAIVEGCVEETVSAVLVAEASLRADPALAPLLRQVADDEARHAELSWAAVRWMLAQRPHLADAARAAFEGHLAARSLALSSPGPRDAALERWGVLSDADDARVVEQVLARVVRPTFEAMLVEA